MRCGYLITRGKIYDGSGGPPIDADLRVTGQMITEIGPDLTPTCEDVIDAHGLLVAPGLIDLHVHVFSGIGQFALAPEQAGLRAGVTTMLDAGTAGALTYPAMQRFIIEHAAEDVFALLNVSMIGLVQGHPRRAPYIDELHDPEHLDAEAAADCLRKNSEHLLGMKVRLSAGRDKGKNERLALTAALKAARTTGSLLMVHHVGSTIPLAEVLESLQAGDIYTHLYHPQSDRGFNAAGAPLDVLRGARARGVHLDVGHGAGSFAWQVAAPACQQFDFWPDSISTDLHQFNIHGPVFDLCTTMTKFLHLGMPIERVIAAVTSGPAKAMRLSDSAGLLATGRHADITLLRLEDRPIELADVEGAIRTAEQCLTPVAAFKRGVMSTCQMPVSSGQ